MYSQDSIFIVLDQKHKKIITEAKRLSPREGTCGSLSFVDGSARQLCCLSGSLKLTVRNDSMSLFCRKLNLIIWNLLENCLISAMILWCNLELFLRQICLRLMQIWMLKNNLFTILLNPQDDYTARLPPIEQLLSEFHVHADIAFFLARPMFNHMINTK